jgi:hypothetical protein
MVFEQVIDFTTTNYDDIRALGHELLEQRRRAGGPTPISVLQLKDRDRPDTYRTVVRFSSYDEAMEHSQREDTSQMAERMAALCDNRSFRNFDLIEEIKP